MVRPSPGNHLLVYGAGEMAPQAQGRHPQDALDAVNRAGGWAFLAHPTDRAVPWAGEDAYAWEDWDIFGYRGLELWNYMSSIKTLMSHPAAGVRTIVDPAGTMVGPEPETLALWDGLLRQGLRVAVIGNSDAHGAVVGRGPLRKTIFPYTFLFRCVHTHVLFDGPLTGDWEADGAALYRAIAGGRAFVGYGLPGDPRGFRFEAQLRADGPGSLKAGPTPVAAMGDVVALRAVVRLRVTAPAEARLRLIRDGATVAEAIGQSLTYVPERPGAYRVEVWKPYRGRERGWIFSNPIYLSVE